MDIRTIERTPRVDLAAFAVAADGATAIAGAGNAAWAIARLDTERAPARRTSLATLALIDAGAAVQAVFSQAMFAAQRTGADLAPFFDAAPWIASRALLLAGVLLVSLLILRRRR